MEKIDEKTIIILNVMKGKDTPYYYKGKAYKRSDTSTLEVDRIEVIQSRDGSEYAPSIKEMCKDKPLMANKLMNIDYVKIHEELKNNVVAILKRNGHNDVNMKNL